MYKYSHWHMYKSNTDCNPWLQKVKPAAFNPLVSHSKALGLLLSTPMKMEHFLVTMVTKHFSAGNHHPELRSSLLCEAQARVLTHGQFPLPMQRCWGFAHCSATTFPHPVFQQWSVTTGTIGAPTRGCGWVKLLNISRGEWLVPSLSMLREISAENGDVEQSLGQASMEVTAGHSGIPNALFIIPFLPCTPCHCLALWAASRRAVPAGAAPASGGPSIGCGARGKASGSQAKG